MYKYLFSLILLSFLLESCEKDNFYHMEHQFDEAGWTYADSLKFDFEIQDTAKRYDLLLKVHHTPEYESENLYVQFSTIFPKGQEEFKGSNRVDQVISLKLANIDGSWLGKCSSKECVYQIPIQINAWFPDAGNYSLLIQQFMRQDSLAAIRGIDFSIQQK